MPKIWYAITTVAAPAAVASLLPPRALTWTKTERDRNARESLNFRAISIASFDHDHRESSSSSSTKQEPKPHLKRDRENSATGDVCNAVCPFIVFHW